MISPEKISGFTNENTESKQKRQNEKPKVIRTEMEKTEKRHLLEKFNDIPKAARAIMSAFFLSTAIGLSTAEAYEKEIFDAKDSQYVIKVINNTEKELNIAGGTIKQKLYSVTDKRTNKIEEFYASSPEDAAEFGPEFVKPLDEATKKIIEKERWLQQSGFTNPDDAYKGPIRVSDDGKDYPSMPNLSKIIKESAHFIAEIKELPEDVVFIKTEDRVDIYNSGDKEENRYIAVSKITGRKIIFESPTEKEAVSYGSNFIKLSPYERVVLDIIKQKEQSLKEYGWSELPGKKYGTHINNSEITKNGKKIHTEARRYYDPDSKFDVIAAWQIDEKGNDVGYQAISKEEDGELYDKYFEAIMAERQK